MAGSSQHQHDALARLQPAHTMHHAAGGNRPALASLAGNAFDLAFGDPGIVLQMQRCQRMGLIVCAYHALEYHQRPRITRVLAQRLLFGSKVKRLFLNGNGQPHAQPPVTGGRMPTSAPSGTGTSP